MLLNLLGRPLYRFNSIYRFLDFEIPQDIAMNIISWALHFCQKAYPYRHLGISLFIVRLY